MTHAAPGTAPVVIVTGASSGIGRATSVLLSKHGMRVVMASRSHAALVEAQGECAPDMTLVVPTDVSDVHQVDALFGAAIEGFGRVDAVVHSAAVLAYGRFEDVPVEVFDRALQVTVTGTANVARASLRLFASHGGGRLVVVGSLLGKIATPYMSSYVTAKWAVHGLVRSLQIEARQTPGVEVSPRVTGWRQHTGLPPGGNVPWSARPSSTARRLARARGTGDRPTDRASSSGDVGRRDERGGGVGLSDAARYLRPACHAAHGGWRTVARASGRRPWQRPGATIGRRGRARTVGRRPRRRPQPCAGLRAVAAARSRTCSTGLGREDVVMTDELSPHGRARVTRQVEAPAAAVWAVLSDGWLYANWVVGASRVRDVDHTWPQPGSKIHHSFGVWPAVVDDESISLEVQPNRLMVLQAKGWPMGEARVEIRIQESGDEACEVAIVEDAVKGPGVMIPRPVRQSIIVARNKEALQRLALIAEGRHREWVDG